ncbi:MAG: hypothetical protein ACR2HA_06900 [Nocardioides sp.]
MPAAHLQKGERTIGALDELDIETLERHADGGRPGRIRFADDDHDRLLAEAVLGQADSRQLSHAAVRLAGAVQGARSRAGAVAGVAHPNRPVM